MVLQQKPLGKADFMVIIIGPVMVRPASSDKWKAPLESLSLKIKFNFKPPASRCLLFSSMNSDK